MRRHHLVAPRLDAAVALGELKLHLVGQGDAVLHRQLVERPRDRPLHARAVVAPDPEHERVVELAQLVDRIENAADVVVGVLGVARVDLHLPGVEGLELLRDVVPGGEGFLVARRQLGVGRNDPELLLPREGLLTQLVPPLVELALVLRCPLLRHVMRSVATAGREVGEEGLRGVLRPDRVQPLDRLVPHVVGQVVGVLGVFVVEGLRGADDLLVLRQARVPLTRPAAEEPVEVIESPAGGPAVERPGGTLLAVRRQVPLAERRGAVPVVPQDSREWDAVVRDERRVARESGRELADRAEADRVAVAAGEQSRSRRRAQRCNVEAVVLQALVGRPGVVGRRDRPAEGRRIPEAGVVDQDQEDVRRTVWGRDVPDRLPVRLRAVERPLHHSPERRLSDRELGAIGMAHLLPPDCRGERAQASNLGCGSGTSSEGGETPAPPGCVPGSPSWCDARTGSS